MEFCSENFGEDYYCRLGIETEGKDFDFVGRFWTLVGKGMGLFVHLLDFGLITPGKPIC